MEDPHKAGLLLCLIIIKGTVLNYRQYILYSVTIKIRGVIMKFQVISKELLTKKRHRIATRNKDFQDLKYSVNASGIQYPLIVNKKGKDYEVIDGRRRLRACTDLNWDNRIKIPVLIVKFKKTDDIVGAIIKEIGKKKLDLLSKTEIANLLCNKYEISIEKAAKHLALSASRVKELLRTFEVPEPTLKALRENKIKIDTTAVLNEKIDYHDLCLAL